MANISSYFGGSGGGTCCPQYIFFSSQIWCPSVAGDVIVHVVGGGGPGATCASDHVMGGGAGGYTHKCITVSTSECYCFRVASTYHSDPSCACTISGATLALCATHGGSLDAPLSMCICDAGMGYGGDVNYCGGKGAKYFTEGTKCCTSFGGAVNLFGSQSNGSTCVNACKGTTGTSVKFGDGSYVTGELEGTNAIHPSVTYLKRLNWGSTVGVGGYNGIATGNGGLFASSGYIGGQCGCSTGGGTLTLGRGAGNAANPTTFSVNPTAGSCGVVIVEYLTVS